MEEFIITVTIADRIYKLTIEKDEEEMVRKAARLIDEKIKEYAISYAYKDKQDLLAMIALQYTTSAMNYEHTLSFYDTQLEDKLTEIDKVLSEYQETPNVL